MKTYLNIKLLFLGLLVALCVFGAPEVSNLEREKAIMELSEEARDALMNGNFKSAAKAYMKMHEMAVARREKATHLLKAADAYFRAEKGQDALECYQMLLQQYPLYAPYAYVVGQMRKLAEDFIIGEKTTWGMKEVEKAIKIYELIIREAPAEQVSRDDRMRVAELMVQEDRREEAVAVLRALLKLNFKDWDAHARLAFILSDLSKQADGDGAKARAAVREAQLVIKNDPQNLLIAELEQLVDDSYELSARRLCEQAEFYLVPAHKRLTAARRYFLELIQKYPKSPYAEKARAYMEENAELARLDLEITNPELAKKLAEEEAKKIERQLAAEEEAKKAEEARIAEEERKKAEAKRLAEEAEKAAEAARIAEEERKKAAEKAAEEARLAEEKKAEEARLAEERRKEAAEKAAEEARIAEEKKAEEARLAEERRKEAGEKAAEEARLAEERRKAEEERKAAEAAIAARAVKPVFNAVKTAESGKPALAAVAQPAVGGNPAFAPVVSASGNVPALAPAPAVAAGTAPLFSAHPASQKRAVGLNRRQNEDFLPPVPETMVAAEVKSAPAVETPAPDAKAVVAVATEKPAMAKPVFEKPASAGSATAEFSKVTTRSSRTPVFAPRPSSSEQSPALAPHAERKATGPALPKYAEPAQKNPLLPSMQPKALPARPVTPAVKASPKALPAAKPVAPAKASPKALPAAKPVAPVKAAPAVVPSPASKTIPLQNRQPEYKYAPGYRGATKAGSAYDSISSGNGALFAPSTPALGDKPAFEAGTMRQPQRRADFRRGAMEQPMNKKAFNNGAMSVPAAQPQFK